MLMSPSRPRGRSKRDPSRIDLARSQRLSRQRAGLEAVHLDRRLELSARGKAQLCKSLRVGLHSNGQIARVVRTERSTDLEADVGARERVGAAVARQTRDLDAKP